MRPSNIRSGIVPMMLMLLSACSSGERNGTADSTPADEYHADNDIVMTINSVIDAISVGEPVDSAAYDYEAILTDGAGRPLYTDLQGAPGMWDIGVENDSTIAIRNLYLGDLLPADLEQYVVSQIRARDFGKVEAHDLDDDDEAEVSAYRFNAGSIRFETRVGRTTNGLEGPLMTIRISGRQDDGAPADTPHNENTPPSKS